MLRGHFGLLQKTLGQGVGGMAPELLSANGTD